MEQNIHNICSISSEKVSAFHVNKRNLAFLGLHTMLFLGCGSVKRGSITKSTSKGVVEGIVGSSPMHDVPLATYRTHDIMSGKEKSPSSSVSQSSSSNNKAVFLPADAVEHLAALVEFEKKLLWNKGAILDAMANPSPEDTKFCRHILQDPNSMVTEAMEHVILLLQQGVPKGLVDEIIAKAAAIKKEALDLKNLEDRELSGTGVINSEISVRTTQHSSKASSSTPESNSEAADPLFYITAGASVATAALLLYHLYSLR